MHTTFGGFDQAFDVLAALSRHIDHAPVKAQAPAAWPRFNLFDAGANLVLTADIPGIAIEDLALTFEDGILTIAGERKAFAPEGHSAHRRERPAFRFERSVTLPVKVDGEKISAATKDGVLTITLEKAANTGPRQITVRAAS